MFDSLIQFVREQYRSNAFVPLHAPVFAGRERDMEAYTRSHRTVDTVNGTAALHVALKLAGVQPGERVITQPLTFAATCNAIAYCRAEPVFVDVDRHTLRLSPKEMNDWHGGPCTGGRRWPLPHQV